MKQVKRTSLTYRKNVPKLGAAEQLAEKYGVHARTINRDGKLAETVEALGLQKEVATGELTAPKSEVIEAAKLVVERQSGRKSWKVESKESPLIPPLEPLRITSEIEQQERAHVANYFEENEWYAPEEFIESARNVLGDDCNRSPIEIGWLAQPPKLHHQGRRSIARSHYASVRSQGAPKRL